MRKTAFLLSLLLCAASMFSCGSAETSDTSETSQASSEAQQSEDGIDYDLTTMSSTMIYSTVSNMILYPDVYEGKIVKLEGNFSVYHDEGGDKYIFAAIVPDATACCQQGIEFVLDGDYKYPDDYPEEGQSITIKGSFNSYDEYGFKYVQLLNAEMKVNA
jgi:hypothetical protein